MPHGAPGGGAEASRVEELPRAFGWAREAEVCQTEMCVVAVYGPSAAGQPAGSHGSPGTSRMAPAEAINATRGDNRPPGSVHIGEGG